MPDPSTSPIKKLLVFIAAVILIGGVFFFWLPDRQPAPEDSPATDFIAAVSLKNESLAQLENNELDAAAEGFQKLIEEMPEQTLGYQNLAVTLLLKLTSLNKAQEPDAYQQVNTQLSEILAVWKELDLDNPDRIIIEARRHDLIDERESAISDYLAAAELAPSEPFLPFQAYQIMQQRPDEYDVSERRAAIVSAFERSPENIPIVINYLRFLAETQDEKFLEVLDNSRELFVPLSARVRETLPKLFDKAAEAVQAGDWKTAQTQLGFTGNLLLAEIAYTNDLNRLNPHPLEFVALDYSLEFYESARKGLSPSPSSISVTFDAQALDLETIDADVTAVGTADLTLDGTPEMIVATGTKLIVYALPKPGEPLFELELPFAARGMIAADLDRDYQSTRDEALKNVDAGLFDTDLDLIVWGDDGLLLVRNDFQQSEQTPQLSLVEMSEELQNLKQVSDAQVADLDHDGDLDFTVVSGNGVSLWSNNGNWTFADFTSFSHLPDAELNLQQITSADIDRNMLNDFVVTAEAEPGLFLLENNLHGRYVSRPQNLSLGKLNDVQVVDLNRDASWDLLTLGEQGLTRILGKTLVEGGWKAGDIQSISAQSADELLTWDYNNDGLIDALTAGESGLTLYTGDVTGNLNAEPGFLRDLSGAEQVTVVDADWDGDQDLIVLSAGKVQLVTNEGGNQNHWIDVRLRAEEIAQTPRERCNMHGIGNLLELKAGGLYQCRTVSGPVTHFGLGQLTEADVLRILWTNGIPHNVLHPKADDIIFEQQQLKGSCPYLYTWDGEKFVFATDCLWASPIGLQFAQGILAPAREWEYLKISQDQLQPKDGEYVLQMTEELWEAAYYDAVKLMVVDHPEEIDVFTNEKVGPAEIAEFEVHTARKPLIPDEVRDQQGRNILDQVRAADGIYSKTWDESYTQGLTETHWLEFSVGEYETPPSELKLFLTGWVFPTDTSLNIAISQNPEMPRPQPPMLQVPDQNGDWQTVSPYIGFPGGKTKTIVVDLTDQFLTDDYRVRIVTNMEIRWDHLFFTVDEEPGELEATELELLGANLHDRGFSKRITQPHNQPEFFDYQDVNTDPLWPPMGGNFTRYGDVSELIREGDDLQVVMGAGDEMTVRFAVPEKPLPEGWVRDFILYNIGWDKDADLNTVQGQQVEPLPFRAMNAYPYEPEQSFPDTPRHQQYLREYQTRHQTRPAFRTEIRDWNSRP
ncbi:MAG: CRTAC1 family protein [Planctomycetaceae bacterium]|nr:CRTAC1 family protein [Planctomycetaceae bacterium]